MTHTSDQKMVALVTCSMARDLELFALLAGSVDRFVDASVPHRVIVPKADIPQFQRFADSRRTIIAQEDILPVSLWKAPKAFRYLSVLKAGFRRPFYLTPRLEVVRGWMLQQLLKVEVTRQAEETAIMHVDSDVAFFRKFHPHDAFDEAKVRFFRVQGATANPMHAAWVATSSDLLGITRPDPYDAHYVENCVLWSRDVTRAMVERIQETQGRPLHQAIFAAQTMSEYYVYGMYADILDDSGVLAAEDVSFCNSYWPESDTDAVDLAKLGARLHPKHCAIAMQSTHSISIEDRKALYTWAEEHFADDELDT